MTPELETKLAILIDYLENRSRGRVFDDHVAFNSYMDDPELMNWIDTMRKDGRVKPSRFLSR